MTTIYMSWAMSQKLPVGGFKWRKNISKFTEEFIKSYDEDSDKGYIFEVDVKYPKNLDGLHEDLPLLPERMKIGKCKNLACNLYDKKKLCCSHKIIKTSLKSWVNIKEGS